MAIACLLIARCAPAPSLTVPHVEIATLPRVRPILSLLGTTAVLLLGAPPTPLFASPPSDPHYRAGLGFLERGEHALALEELNAFLASAPAGEPKLAATYARAICLLALHRPADAERDLALVLKEENFAFLGDALLLRARMHFDAGEFASAGALIERLERDVPSFKQRSEALLLGGEAFLRSGAHAQSLALLTRVIGEQPTPAIARRALLLAAHAEVGLKQDDAAIKRLMSIDRTSAAPAERAAIALLAAQCCHRTGDIEQAFVQYQAAVVAEATPAALLGVGQTGRRLKSFDAAARALDQLLTDTTPEAVALHATARLERARCALDAGDYARARELFETLDASGSQGDRILAWRAEAQAAMGDRAAAIATLAKAAELYASSPLLPSMHLDRGNMLLAAEAWHEARQAYAAFQRAAPTHAFVPHATVRIALCAAREGASDEARRLFAEALNALPSDASAERELALAESLELATLASDWEAVLPLARDLRASTGNVHRQAEADLRAGIALARLGRPLDALPYLDAACKAQPASSTALIERAEALVALGRQDEAITLLQQALQGSEPSIRLLLEDRLARLFLRLGRTEDAEPLLASAEGDILLDLGIAQAARGQHQQAIDAFDRFAQQAANADRRDEALARRGMSLARLGRTKDALTILTSVDPQALTKELRSGVTFEIALCLDADGQRNRARERLQHLQATPSSYRPYAALELMRIALEEEQFDDVRRLLEEQRALETEARPAERPALEERRIYMASLLATRRQEPADVLVLLGDFETRFPTSGVLASALLLRGQAEFALRQFDDARASYQKLVDLAPPAAILETALLRLGETHTSLERWSDAEAVFARVLTTFPNSPQAPNARFGQGWAREQRGAFASAIESYREVLAVAPTGTTSNGPVAARAQFQIGECHFALKQYEDAVRELLKVDVLYAYPEWSAAALYEAGRCLLALGRPSDARRQFTQLRERYPASPWAERAAAELERLAPDELPGKGTS